MTSDDILAISGGRRRSTKKKAGLKNAGTKGLDVITSFA